MVFYLLSFLTLERIFFLFSSFSPFSFFSLLQLSEELAHDAGVGDVFVADGEEVVEELQQAVGIGVLRTVLGHGGEDDLGMGAEDGKLDVEGGVEHDVGGLLIWEDPLILSLAYVLPLADGLAGGVGSFVIVAHDAAQQSVVAYGYPIVVVEGDAGEGGDVDFVLQMVRDELCELGVKSMDALDDEYAVGGELYFLAVPLALTCDEIIFWKFYSFSL